MKHLTEYAEALEKSGKPSDLAVARYIRTHEHRLAMWVREYSIRMTKADREELIQVAILGCVEAVTTPDLERAILNVRNAMQHHARAAWRWNERTTTAVDLALLAKES